MNGIVEFFSEYGWIALAVTVISAAAGVLLNFIAKDKLSRGVNDVIPTISAIILETTADMLFVKKAFVFDANAVYTGIICGSLATAVAAFVVKIAEGRVTTKDVTDFVAELIEGFIDGERKAEIAEAIVSAAKTQDEEALAETVERLLTSMSSAIISEKDAKEIARSVAALVKNSNTIE